MNIDEIELTGHDQDYLKVLKHQKDVSEKALASIKASNCKADDAIASSEALLASIGMSTSGIQTTRSPEDNILPNRQVKMRSWEEILGEANCAITEEVSIVDILSAEDIRKSDAKIESIRRKFDLEHRLDALDWGIAGIAGVISALVDIFLVKMPSSAGHLGSNPTQGGWLSDKIRNGLKGMYTPEQIAELEKKFKVPYDASTSKNLAEKVAGLGPTVHRFHSLGHDPILGFIFGVRDIMTGQFTAVDKFGKIIVQDIPGADKGISFFEAIARQFGHLKSDIGTPAGLPAPFMPLFQTLQFGNINGRTIGELSRAMYAKGYDFGHFLAMSIPVLIIEVIVRILYFAKRYHETKSIEKSIPFDLPFKRRQPKLQTMLFTAHTIATAANAGKVYFTQNPLAINLPQWLWYAKVCFSQLRWVLFTKEAERLAVVQEQIDADWQSINDDLNKGWTFVEESKSIVL